MKVRIAALIKQEKLSYGQFAEKVGMSNSNVSHLVGGRNKPSLDLVENILSAFPKLNPDWLISGKEPMYRQETQPRPTSLFDFEKENLGTKQVLDEPPLRKNVSENPAKEIKTDETASKVEITPPAAPPDSKIVKKIVVFYSDATYEEFNK